MQLRAAAPRGASSAAFRGASVLAAPWRVAPCPHGRQQLQQLQRAAPPRRRRAVDARASQAANRIEAGNKKYVAGDRMAALKLYEEALTLARCGTRRPSPSLPPSRSLPSAAGGAAHIRCLRASLLRPASREQAPSVRERQVAQFGCTAVHASFGDAELAQMTLRGARV